MGSLLQDIRFALRTLRKNPVFTTISVVCLTLGVATNTTLFSVTDAILWRPFGFTDPERLMVLRQRDARTGNEGNISWLDYADLRRALSAFEGLGVETGRAVAITEGDEPERLQASLVSWDLFPMLGIRPQLGRGFLADEDRAGAEPVVLLSDELWHRRYAGDPGIVGRAISVNGIARTVVGIMPARFAFPETSELWLPAGPVGSAEDRRWDNFTVYGRLRAGTSVDAAAREFDATWARMAATNGRVLRDWHGYVKELRAEFIPENIRVVVLAMMGAVTFVLLIACANVANLMLARASGRAREIAIRSAIGAGRRHIVRQLLTESTLVALAAGALAVPLTHFGLQWLSAAIPAEDAVPYYIQWQVDGRTLAYTFVVAIAAGALFGLAPALQAGRARLVDALRDGARGTAGGHASGRLRSILVVVEVALCLVLLVGASLFVRSFINLRTFASGLETTRVMTWRYYLPGPRYDSNTVRLQRSQDILRRVAALPGAAAVTVSPFVPYASGPRWDATAAEGREVEAGRQPLVSWTSVSAGALRTLGIGLQEGRWLSDQEVEDSIPVAVVQRSLGQLLWPGESPIGRRFQLHPDSAAVWFTVVGVMSDFTWNAPTGDRRAPPLAMVPLRFQQSRTYGVMVRVGSGDPSALAGAVRDAIRSSDPALPVFDVRTLEDARRNQFWQFGLFGGMFGLFGADRAAARRGGRVWRDRLRGLAADAGDRRARRPGRPPRRRPADGHRAGCAAGGARDRDRARRRAGRDELRPEPALRRHAQRPVDVRGGRRVPGGSGRAGQLAPGPPGDGRGPGGRAPRRPVGRPYTSQLPSGRNVGRASPPASS